MGDGGFWHNGLTSGIANAVFNRSDNLTIVVDNNYTSATGGQDLLSSKGDTPVAQHRPRDRERGARRRRRVGEDGRPHLRRRPAARRLARRADDEGKGPKVLVAQSECMLNRQRREKPLVKAAVARGERVVRERFGVDADTCTGDHSCIRLSGCPSLTIKANPDPLPHRSGRDGARQLRRLRRVRRGLARGGAVPVVLQAPSIVSNPTGSIAAGARARRASSARCSGAMRRASARARSLARTWPSLRDATPRPTAPIKIAILAIGGEGGGVLADWIVDLGEHAWLPRAGDLGARRRAAHRRDDLLRRALPAAAPSRGAAPVLALMPMPGDVDIVLASELMEAAAPSSAAWSRPTARR